MRSIFMLLVGLVCTSANAQESKGASDMSLLKNGAFEEVSTQNGALTGWRVADWSAAAIRKPIRLVPETVEPAEGKTCARIVSENTGGNLVMQQDVKRAGAGKYVLKLKCRPDEGSSAYASLVGIAAGKNLVYENTKRVTDATQWTALELSCEAPVETALIRVLLRTNRGACFDDVSLVLVDASGSILDTRKEPSSGKALAQKRNAVAYDLEFDRKRKAEMSPDELAWETVLEQNLGSFYLPLYKQAKEKGRETAWDYVKDDPALPRVLLIGDSISRGYTVATRHALNGKVNLHRAPANCGPTALGLSKLDVWLGNGKWDLIHFNFGIHDQRSSSEDYAKRLEEIVVRLEKAGAKLVFASSTPLPEDSEKYQHGACARLNQVAAEIMARHNIPIDDLYSAMLPKLAEFQNPGDCHFKGDGYVFMGNIVAEKILKTLAGE